MIHMPTEFEDILTDLDSEFKRAFPNRNYQEEYKKIEQKIQKENWIPKKRFVDKVSAELFLKHPEKYGRKGKWIKRRKKKTP